MLKKKIKDLNVVVFILRQLQLETTGLEADQKSMIKQLNKLLADKVSIYYDFYKMWHL